MRRLIALIITILLSTSNAVEALAPQAWDAGGLPTAWQSALEARVAEAAALPTLSERVQGGISLFEQSLEQHDITPMQQHALVHHVRAAVLKAFHADIDALTAQAKLAHDRGGQFQEQTALTSLKTLAGVLQNCAIDTAQERSETLQTLTQAVSVMPMLLQRAVLVEPSSSGQVAHATTSTSKKGWVAPTIGVACGLGVVAVATIIIAVARYRAKHGKDKGQQALPAVPLIIQKDSSMVSRRDIPASAPAVVVNDPIGSEERWHRSRETCSHSKLHMVELFRKVRFRDGKMFVPQDLGIDLKLVYQNVKLSSVDKDGLVEVSGLEQYMPTPLVEVLHSMRVASATA